MKPTALHLLLLTFAGITSRGQQRAIAYLLEENRVLRQLLGNRPRLNDAQQRRLAKKGHVLGRKRLVEVCSIVTADTILRWYRRLVAQKYTAIPRARVGRPRRKDELRALVVMMA